MNWKAWLQWADAHEKPALFALVIVLFVFPLFVLFAGLKLRAMARGMKYGLSRTNAWLLIGVSLQTFCFLVAGIDGPRNVVYTTWYLAWTLSGQSVFVISLAIHALWIMWPQIKKDGDG